MFGSQCTQCVHTTHSTHSKIYQNQHYACTVARLREREGARAREYARDKDGDCENERKSQAFGASQLYWQNREKKHKK